MFPIRDQNRTESFPIFAYGIIAINVLVFLYQANLNPEEERNLIRDFGFKPAFAVAYFQGEKEIIYREQVLSQDFLGQPVAEVMEMPMRVDFWNSLFPLLTSLFLHGGIAHLLGNMWFLHIFGDNVEDRLGRVRFLIFYFVAGLAASLAQFAVSPGSTVPCVGASGAISGVLGAYALIFPHARVLSVIPLGFFLQLLEIPAYIFLFIWFGLQVVSGLFSSPGEGGVAWWAHIGGFLAGAAFVKVIPPRGPRAGRLRGRLGGPRDVPFWHVRE